MFIRCDAQSTSASRLAIGHVGLISCSKCYHRWEDQGVGAPQNGGSLLLSEADGNVCISFD